MQDNVSVIIATIVAVIIIVLFPIYNIATRQDSIANNMVVKATTNFVDEVRNKGYIDKEAYGKYLNELDKTGNTYEVEMEVYSSILLADVNDPDIYEEKYEIEYTDEILKDMDNSTLFKDEDSVIKSNVKYLDSDDKFYVRVKNTNITQAQILLDRLLRGKQDERIIVNYGGVVYTNEWEHGENAETTSSNISLSRPLDNNLKEFKYEYITDVYDMYTDELETIYGIAVRLSDDVAGADKIKFRLKYNGVEEIKDSNNRSDEISVERHVKKYIEIEGIVVENEDIEVSQIKKQESNGTYNYEFLITISNIEYDFDNNPYMKAKFRINAGSAYTKVGAVSEINSKEFVVFYEAKDIEITAEAKYYNNSGSQIIGTGKADYARIEVKLNKANENVVDIRYVKGEYTESDFRNASFGESIKNSYNSSSNRYITSSASGKRITENGKYTIYAKDKHGREAVYVLDIIGLGSDRIKFVLNWRTSNDFDMHLVGKKTGNSGQMHVYYSCKNYDDSTFGSANLNQDNTSGGEGLSKAEIIILERAEQDVKYTCYVHDFTNRKSSR